MSPNGASLKSILVQGKSSLKKTAVDLLLPSIISRLYLLHERGCTWLSAPILPLLVYTHSTLQSLINVVGYDTLSARAKIPSKKMSSGETKKNDSETYRTFHTVMELEVSLSNLITRMSTQMIASVPVSRSELGKASLWLESNLFSGGITDATNEDSASISSRFMYDITVESHEPLGLWLADPPDGTLHHTFSPYVYGYRRVGVQRKPSMLEKMEKVRPGHRLVGVRSLRSTDNQTITVFENVEHAYRVLKKTPRPMVLTFHTLSQTDVTSYKQVYRERLRFECKTAIV